MVFCAYTFLYFVIAQIQYQHANIANQVVDSVAAQHSYENNMNKNRRHQSQNQQLSASSSNRKSKNSQV